MIQLLTHLQHYCPSYSDHTSCWMLTWIMWINTSPHSITQNWLSPFILQPISSFDRFVTVVFHCIGFRLCIMMRHLCLLYVNVSGFRIIQIIPLWLCHSLCHYTLRGYGALCDHSLRSVCIYHLACSPLKASSTGYWAWLWLAENENCPDTAINAPVQPQ